MLRLPESAPQRRREAVELRERHVALRRAAQREDSTFEVRHARGGGERQGHALRRGARRQDASVSVYRGLVGVRGDDGPRSATETLVHPGFIAYGRDPSSSAGSASTIRGRAGAGATSIRARCTASGTRRRCGRALRGAGSRRVSCRSRRTRIRRPARIRAERTRRARPTARSATRSRTPPRRSGTSCAETSSRIW